MTASRRRSAALAAPLLLAPLLLTACASGGTTSAATTSSGAAAASTTGSSPSPAAASRDLTSAQVCALVPVAAAQAAGKADPAFTKAETIPDQSECLYEADRGSIVTVDLGPTGSGLVDAALEIDSKTPTTPVQVAGHQGKAIDQVVQVDVGDQAISVFTIGHELSRAQLVGLAAAFVAKLS